MAHDQYVDKTDLKNMIGLSGTSQDNNIDNAINASSRLIDQITGRHFYKSQSVQVKYFTPDNHYILDVPDIATTTGLIVQLDTTDDGSHNKTITLDTDFYLKAINVTDLEGDNDIPYQTLVILDKRSSERFDPDIVKNVKITATWGFNAIPDAIKQACLLQSSRLWKRKDSPFSTYGSGDTGETELFQKMDPDAKTLIKPYIKHRL
jgi:ribonuclease BN (tRNA processing enzyme)